MRVKIGPLEGHYGGAAQHIINLVRHSKDEFDYITLPKSLELWGKFFRKVILPIQKKIPHSLEHSDKRFDMYGLQSYLDIPSKMITSTYSDYGAVHLHGHPWWQRIYDSTKNPNTVYTVHNLYNKSDFSKKWRHTIETLGRNMLESCRKSKSVISVSKWLQEALWKRYSINSYYIPNGVNLGEMDQGNAERFRQKNGIDGDFYLFVGRSTRYKRPELFSELARENKDKKFVMVGRGLTKSSFQKYLSKEAPENIAFVGEPSRQDVVDAFHACRVFILPSSNETFGIVLLEAMAAGKPVVAANNLGPKEIVIPGEQGFLFSPDDLESLIKKANLAWKNPQMGLAGRALVEADYDWEKIAPLVERVYRLQ